MDGPVTILPGIGPKRAQTIKQLGLETVRDVLFSFPRDYKDFQRVHLVHEVKSGQEQLVTGKLINLHERPISGGRRVVQAQLDGYLTLTWFVHHRNRGPSYLYRNLQKAQEIWVYGLVKDDYGGLEMTTPEFFYEAPMHLGLMPVYPLMSTVTNAQRVRWVKESLKYLSHLDECLPPSLRGDYVDRHTALRWMHFPKNWSEQQSARERLVYEEFLLFHLSLQRGARHTPGVMHGPDGQLVARYLKSLPFQLTNGQRNALQDVAKDMESPLAMRRLIQGEVGSGKTIVAEYGAVKAVENGGQVAMMVPTEVLARQMAQRIKSALEPLGITVELLIGNLPGKEQTRVREGIQDGSIQVVVGTHALITEKVLFANLTLAIVDEQHRFGVRQRLALQGKGNADLLVMSATPIPRSLALTAYGDLDTSEIRELPKGRQVVDTRLIDPKRRTEVYQYLVKRVKSGEQGYVVFPLVEESEHLDAKAAVTEMEALQHGVLKEIRVGLIHGQMGKEKEQIFEAFYRQEIDVLIATTVIEVGMNVPNATVMIIENAERFGLAQLHQLRGRVGRGSKPGICFLLSYSDSRQSRERLEVIRGSTDGFLIAEEDLRIRGPGDLLGVRQWGMPLFRVGDIVEDQDMLKSTAAEAQALLDEDPNLVKYPQLLAEIERQQW